MEFQKPADFYKARRDALMKKHPSSIFLLPSNELIFRNRDVHYPFRQESCFYYLTGFEEPNSFLALVPMRGSYKSILFVEPRNPAAEARLGKRYGPEEAAKVFGMDEAHPIHELRNKLPPLLFWSQQIYYEFGAKRTSHELVTEILSRYRNQMRGEGPAVKILDPDEALGDMRLIKSPEEIEAMRKVCQLSAQAHKTAMQEVRPGMHEYEIAALIEYILKKGGCQRLGYGSIVAGGKNARGHYQSNRDVLRDGDLLLVDAGGELDYYTADITRTYPVGRSFSKIQEKVYDVVLKAQTEAIALVKPGGNFLEVHQRAGEILLDGILSLGLRKGTRQEIHGSGALMKLNPGAIGHWLGMEVHDAGTITKEQSIRKFEPGMVLTIEPGLCLRSDDPEIPAEFWDIGIRIEDDVLVTEDGCEVLSKDVPKHRDEIESLRRG